MDYKINNYLYLKDSGKKTFVVNLYNQIFFSLRKCKADLIKNKDIDQIKKDTKLYEALIKSNVLVPKELNQFDLILSKNRYGIFDNRSYRLTINPTLECNFSCWYCYEKHPKGRMSDTTIKSVIEHIRRKIEVEKIAHLQIDWFGGEPLLYFETVMLPIMKAVQSIVQTNHISYNSGITTNGYLITKEMVQQFDDLSINSFQITLDGNKQQHDRIRFIEGSQGSFDQIVQNINLLSSIRNVKIALRINYIQKTLVNIADIISEFSNETKSIISVRFQQVWQDSSKKQVSSEECEQVFINQGIQVVQSDYNTKQYVCYADKMQQAVINYDGKVYKCTARDFATYSADGTLLESGEIDWNLHLFAKRFGRATFDNLHCSKCNFLPVCFGPCSQKMLEFKDGDNFDRICYKKGILQMIERDINLLK